MKLKLSFVPFVLASLVGLAHADESPMVLAKKMAAQYQSAVLKKDFVAFEKESTPDFVYISAKGQKTTRAQAFAGMKSFYGSMTFKSVKVTAVSAKLAEGGLIYIQDTKMEGTSKMFGPKPALFKSDSRDEVLVIKKGGKWLTKRVRNLKSVDTVDGKPMPGM